MDVYNRNASGEYDFIGSFKPNSETLKTAAIKQSIMPVIAEKKLSKEKNENSHEITFKALR